MHKNELNKIEIYNFKSIKALTLTLDDLNIFIGPNGAGKSNFIGVFKFLNKIINKQLQIYTAEVGGADSILYFGRKSSEELKIKLSFSNYTHEYEINLLPSNEDNFFFGHELVWLHDKKRNPSPYRLSLGSGQNESKLPDSKNKILIPKHAISIIKNWKLYHFHDTSDSAKIKQTCDLEDNQTLQPNAGNLAAFLFKIKEKHPDNFLNIEDTIKLAAPFFEGFNLQPSRLNEGKIKLEWKEKGSDDYFNASALSDGTLRFMCLATLLLQPELPSTIILDEPELGLHPYAITVLADLLRAAA